MSSGCPTCLKEGGQTVRDPAAPNTGCLGGAWYNMNLRGCRSRPGTTSGRATTTKTRLTKMRLTKMRLTKMRRQRRAQIHEEGEAPGRRRRRLQVVFEHEYDRGRSPTRVEGARQPGQVFPGRQRGPGPETRTGLSTPTCRRALGAPAPSSASAASRSTCPISPTTSGRKSA